MPTPELQYYNIIKIIKFRPHPSLFILVIGKEDLNNFLICSESPVDAIEYKC